MNKLTYEEPSRYNHEQIEKILMSGDEKDIAEMLVGIAFYDEDLEFKLKIIYKCSEYQSEIIRGTAILCLGHVVRIHGAIPEEPSISIVKSGLSDKNDFVKGQAWNAYEDFQVYAPSLSRKIKAS